MIEYLIGFLKMNDVEYEENKPLKKYSSVGIGADARIISFPTTLEQLCNLACYLDKNNYRHKILGRMSNVLPPDDDYQGVIVKTDKLSSFCVKDEKITVDAGMPLPRLSYVASDMGLSGLEELSGIPGSIGGAIFGNAGAFGREIADIVRSVTCFNPVSNEVVRLRGDQCGFSYRSSLFKYDRSVILSVEFSLISASREKTLGRIDEVKKIRLNTQPVGQKSLGSTFKRTKDGISAAALIDRCGLKGYSIGGAQISTKHAGFIVNTGDAKASDYIDLMDYTERVVMEKLSVKLTREIEII